MRRALQVAAVAALAGAASAGPAGDARAVVGSCTFPVTCQDYDTSREDAKHRCDALGARWRDEACPRARLVATCVNAWDEGQSVTHFYAPTTRAEAAEICREGRGRLR